MKRESYLAIYIYYCDKCEQAIYRGNIYIVRGSLPADDIAFEYCRNCIADVMTANKTYTVNVIQAQDTENP